MLYEMTEDKIRLIALTAANEVSRAVDAKLDKINSRITKISNDVATTKGRVSMLADGVLLKKTGLSTGDWLKILGLVIAASGVGFGFNLVSK